jgi:hypothetical protein
VKARPVNSRAVRIEKITALTVIRVREVLGHQDGAKLRAGAWGAWELRLYERNRCAEHGVTVNTAFHRWWSWSHHRRS